MIEFKNLWDAWMLHLSKKPNYSRKALDKVIKEAEKKMKILKKGGKVKYTIPYQK